MNINTNQQVNVSVSQMMGGDPKLAPVCSCFLVKYEAYLCFYNRIIYPRNEINYLKELLRQQVLDHNNTSFVCLLSIFTM